MDAAERASGSEETPIAGIPRGAREVLDRIVRLACRAAATDEAAVVVRSERDPLSLVRVAQHPARPGEARDPGEDAALEQALATGSPAAAEAGGRLRAAAPLVWGGKVRGALVAAGGRRVRRFGRPELEALVELAELASAALQESDQRERLEEIVGAGVAALVRAVDMRDDYTGRHSESVQELAIQVGSRLGMDGSELWLLELAARLHDVGKIGVPDTILNKPGPLDADEWATMQSHAELGAEMVAKVPGLEPVAPLVRAHHERWDGRGYPDGVGAEAIPLASRVIAVCDSYQAMTADRPYRAALSEREALVELADGAGSQFDPAVVAALRAERSVRSRAASLPGRGRARSGASPLR